MACEEAVKLLSMYAFIKGIYYNVLPVDDTDLETQRSLLAELAYYQLASKGMEVSVPILVIDNEETNDISETDYERYFGEDAITKLKEMLNENNNSAERSEEL